ncbi:protein U59 [Elephant endotheliotropic herpesvirus 5B]|uniref:Tegument protein UL88 n=1 Tax=Elephant endotheliotropic herpesvirus 5 TaxID=768738 RepID=A0A075CYH4_9BETA|nr:tegument protein UL88 [Elephant endotheliotropic herpesvirus 5]AHC02855.1 tegument protein UL88 [Elephant endotheliotropic herpesvirus 5]UVZ35266.1 protein U59 [Elephant endotheliotropic herpesvirus 5B]
MAVRPPRPLTVTGIQHNDKKRWSNGELWSDEKCYETFVFINQGLADLLGIRGDTVTIADISLYVNNGCHTNTPEITIFWKSNSSLLYLLSGVTYCYSIIISSGSLNNRVMNETPRLYLRDHVALSPLAWPDSLKIEKVSGTADKAPRYDVYAENFITRPNIHINGRLESLLSICFHLLSDPSKFPERNIDFNYFVRTAGQNSNPKFIHCNTPPQHQFLCHVAMMELGERNETNMVLNAMYVEIMWVSSPKCEFFVYTEFKHKLVTTCQLLNSIYHYYENLPKPNVPVDHVKSGQCVKTYFNCENLDVTVIAYGIYVLHKMIQTQDTKDLISYFQKYIRIEKHVTTGQLKRLLRMYY